MTAQEPNPPLLSRLAVTPAWLEPDPADNGPRSRIDRDRGNRDQAGRKWDDGGPEYDYPDEDYGKEDYGKENYGEENYGGEENYRGERYRDERYLDEDDQDHRAGPRLIPKMRWRTTPLAAVVLVIVGVLAAGYAAYATFAGPVREAAAMPQVAMPSRAGAASDMATPSAASSAELVVSVVGLVRRPGLVRVPPQSRIADAIARAGGAAQGADLLSLNLAAPLRDGDQILVGFRDRSAGMRSSVTSAGGHTSSGGAAGAGGAAADASSRPGDGANAGGKVNLNTASESDLDALPGVGPVTAKAILAWRQEHGKFGSVDQLGEVDGIGPAKLAALRPRVTV